MQYMLILAHAAIKNVTPEKEAEVRSEELWETKLREAQERTASRMKSKEEQVASAQKRISEMITNKE